MIREFDQIGATPAGRGIPSGCGRVSRDPEEGVGAHGDVAAKLTEPTQTAHRIQRGIEEAERPAGVLIEVGDYARPLRRAFAGSTNEVVTIGPREKAPIHENEV